MRWRRLCGMRLRLGLAVAARAICRWWCFRWARSSGWSASMRQSRTCWRWIDLSLLEEASRAERLACVLAQDRAERFDLGCAPLMRFALIRLAADEHRLVLTHHHLLMDGWSLPVLVRELFTLYAHNGD